MSEQEKKWNDVVEDRLSQDEIETLKQLKDEMQNEYIKVPDSLKPENVEAMLNTRTRADDKVSGEDKTLSENNQNINTNDNDEEAAVLQLSGGKTHKKRFHWKSAYAYAAIAASLVIVLGISAVIVSQPDGNTSSGSMYGNEIASSGTNGSVAASDSEEESKSNTSGSENDEKTDSDVENVTQIASAKDYDEIYSYIEAQNDQNNGYATEEVQLFSSDGASNSSASSDSSMAAGSNAKSSNETASASAADVATTDAGYSDTNVRTTGVAEGDIVKTDGKYLYILNGLTIQIVDIQDKEMKAAGTIDIPENASASELYVKDGTLAVFYTEQKQDGTNEENANEDSIYDGSVYRSYATVQLYDVSNPEMPKSLSTVSQSGDYDTMRVVDGYLYLFSQYYINNWNLDAKNISDYVPYVQGNAISADHIYLPPYVQGSQYMVISAIDLGNPDKVADSKAVLSQGGMCYVSTESIYICDPIYGTGENYTRSSIRKVSYKKGKLSGVAQTKVWGTLNDSFSIDEYDGNVRLVTTVNANGGGLPWMASNGAKSASTAELKDSNALYILDENLNLLGKIEGLAADETVYSARFMGENGYFVTFKQTDPLFSVDLSDPKNPKVLDYLKIPGFSEYLHPYGEGLLLGIGMNTDEDGATDGAKLSMFDISDPTNVKEEQKSLLEGVYSLDVAYDYKGVMIDSEKNLIGFAGYADSQHYYIYRYDKEKGFSCVFDRKLSQGYSVLRGMYSEDRFYLIEGNAVESFDLDSFEKIDDIVL